MRSLPQQNLPVHLGGVPPEELGPWRRHAAGCVRHAHHSDMTLDQGAAILANTHPKCAVKDWLSSYSIPRANFNGHATIHRQLRQQKYLTALWFMVRVKGLSLTTDIAGAVRRN